MLLVTGLVNTRDVAQLIDIEDAVVERLVGEQLTFPRIPLVVLLRPE